MFPVVHSGGAKSSATAEMYMQTHENTAYLQHYTLHNFGNDLLKWFIQFLNVRTKH